jgi:hypothetical protein
MWKRCTAINLSDAELFNHVVLLLSCAPTKLHVQVEKVHDNQP